MPNGSAYIQGSYPGVTQIFSAHLCPDNYVVHLAFYLMWNRLYGPSQCNITQRPARHDTLHTLQTPSDHTDPNRCFYTCCRQNTRINSSQLVLEVTNCCTVLISLYCDFTILCLSTLCTFGVLIYQLFEWGRHWNWFNVLDYGLRFIRIREDVIPVPKHVAVWYLSWTVP
jgi:hypothetical protein